MALEGALVGYAVSKLLDQVLTAINLVKDHHRNLKALRSLLEDLQPLVSRFSAGAPSPRAAVPWLIKLKSRLEEAGQVVQEWKTLDFIHLWKTIQTAKKVIKVTQAIKELLQEANAVVLIAILGLQDQHVDVAAELKKVHDDVQAIGRHISQFQGLVTRMQLSLRTRMEFDKPVGRALAVRTTGAHALAEIKGHANITAAALYEAYSDVVPASLTAQLAQLSLIPSFPETIFGRNEFMRQVKESLLSNENDKWVGLWSMGGAGKTLIAQMLYSDRSVQRHFTGGLFWLTVSKERSIASFLQDLCRIITGHYDLTIEMAKDRVTQKLRNTKKLLLVLDDVWSSAVLDDLDVLRGSYGNKIFLTTRNVEILNKKHATKWSIPMLSPLHSWQLFCLHAFNGTDKVPPPLENCARQIAGECCGLPLALKVIGAAMSGKSSREWNQFLRRLQYADTIDKDLERQLYDRLQLSVDDLPGIHKHLKDCFYYFAAFPEDKVVRVKEDLLGLWTADCIVGTNTAYPPEDEAFELLGWLIARSLIELDDQTPGAYNFRGDYIMTCKIHDVLRDLARRNLQHNIQVHDRVCLYQAGMRLERFPEDWIPTSQSCSGPSLSAERLSVMHNALEELPAQLNAPQLRILLMNDNQRLQTIPTNFLGGLPQIRVLDLSRTRIGEIPPSALSSLKLLVLLNLSECFSLLRIPDSIQQLTNLNELQLYNCKSLKVLPDGLRCLKKLQTLNVMETSVWDTPSTTNLGLNGLNDIPLLKDLAIYSENRQVEFTVKLKLLRHLHIRSGTLQACPDISELGSLETLKLQNMEMMTLPRNIASLSNLKIIIISSCDFLTSLPALDELPGLEQMEVRFCDGLTHLPKSFGRAGAFPSLQEFIMPGCTGVKGFPDLEPGAMPQLLLLDLSCWNQMRILPTSLESLTNLRCLRLVGCTKMENLENVFPSTSFPDLEELHLRGNERLTRLPECLASMRSKLVKIDLRSCPAQDHLPLKVQQLKDLGMLEVLTDKHE